MGCFHLLAILSNAAINIRVQAFGGHISQHFYNLPELSDHIQGRISSRGLDGGEVAPQLPGGGKRFQFYAHEPEPLVCFTTKSFFVLLPLPLCPLTGLSQLIRKRRKIGQNSRTFVIQPFLIRSLNFPLSPPLPSFPWIPLCCINVPGAPGS